MKKKILILSMVVAMLSVLVMPMAALAVDDTGNTEVKGAIGTYYILEVPSTVNLEILSQTGDVSATGLTIALSSNDPAMDTAAVAVKVGGGTTLNPGRMKHISEDAFLVPALTIEGAGFDVGLTATAIPVATAALAMGNITLVDGAGSVTNIIITQPQVTDAVIASDGSTSTTIFAGNYAVVITFTATF